jgi:2-polyprenyl-3-methyl-5-hydroxy-6-metoxy-1,4-benzoquinol methylase
MPICPVCSNRETELWSNARDYEYQTSEQDYKYFTCKTCLSIFIDPLPVDQLSIIYPSNYYSFVKAKKNFVTGIKEGLDKSFFKKILHKIEGSNLKVLDVGGGTGWLSSIIKNIDNRIALTQIVDIDENAKQLAESKGHKYFTGTLEKFETSDKYDLILMLNLIEHVSDPIAVLNKAASLLSDKGLILIKTPNTNSFDARLFRKTYWGGLHAPRHWVIFSEKSFRSVLRSTSLQMETLNYTQAGAFWAFSIIVALHKKKMVRVDKERPVIFHPLFPLLSGIGAAFDFIRRPFSKTSQMFIVLKHNGTRHIEIN